MSISLDATICAYFVNNIKVGSGSETDETKRAQEQLANALELMRNHLDEPQIRQIKPSEGFSLIAAGSLSKKDVFVLAQFEGTFFDQLQMTKALIVGPPCILSCLMKCEPIPLGSSPVYSSAMRDLQISATGITAQEKEQISRLVQWMGGHYFQNFGRSITHLISNTIKSNKYEHATLNGVPVMHVDWVQRVWERSISATGVASGILATDTEFDKYRLPTFFNANITCSGLDAAKKDEVMRLVNENGGNYHRAFRSQLVDIVITEESKTDSEKYKAALRFKKDVLLPEWIFDSQERGYALPTKQYIVRPRKQVSTPTKSGKGVADSTQLSDLSRISFISGNARRMGSDLSTVNETMSSLGSCSPAKSSTKTLLQQATTSSSGSNKAQNYQLALAEICPRQAKQAGHFLDGCCVYLSGFRLGEREKLNRVLNTGGAMRYDEAKEGVTHIIVGQLEDAAYREWQRQGLINAVHIVRLEWLLESIKAGRIVNELVHRVSLPNAREPDAASPASKRTLRSMNHSFKQPDLPIKKKLEFGRPSAVVPAEEPDEQLLTHYSQEQEPAAPLPPAAAPAPTPSPAPAPTPPTPSANETQDLTMQPPAASSTQLPLMLAQPHLDLSASVLSIDFDKLDYFMGASVYVHKESFSSEFYTQMLSECEAAQGNIVSQSFSDPVDYAIISFEVAFDVDALPVQARHLVTELYVESCMKQNKLLPVEYYHQPIPIGASEEPLKGMTVVVSIYSGLERDFINSIAELMGANVNKTFIKKEQPLLICPSAEGSKYEGALKWGYPVVHAAWLVDCAKSAAKLPYREHLVGSSAADFPQSPKERLKEQSRRASKTLTPSTDIENQSKAPTAPETPMTPLRNRRVSELLANCLGRRRSSSSSGSGSNSTASPAPGAAPPPDSPHTPLSQAAAYNFDFLEQFAQRLDSDEQRECVREIIREMREHQTPELERIRRQACTPINRRQQQRAAPAPEVPDFCLTPEFQQRMADDFQRRWRLPKHKLSPETPIAEIRQRVMRITCETLGIPYSEQQQEEQQEQEVEQPAKEETLKTKEKAKPATLKTKEKAKPATPATPATPSNNRTTVGRTLFQQPSPPPEPPAAAAATPPTESSHFVPCTQSPGQNLGLGRSTINFDKISFEETKQGANLSRSHANSTLASDSPELKQITDYLKGYDSRRSSSVKRAHVESEAQYVQPFESEGFMLGTEEPVGWRDPAEFNAAKRRSTGSPRMQFEGTPRFSISCGDDDRRAELIEKIGQLGGEMCENLNNYDEGCTHFLCERPNRGEKMLGCIAAGKWVLNINYIEESHARGSFVDEELYEWGNARALNLPVLPPEEQLIASAAHRWRTQLAKSCNGAFAEHRVILSLQERSLVAIKNVLRAGGGHILEPSSPFSSDPAAATATHCFVDAKKAPLAARDHAYLQQRGVRIMSQMCINAYLMAGREADLEKYVLRQ